MHPEAAAYLETSSDDELRREAHVFGWYLIGSSLSGPTIDRYIRGCRTLELDRISSSALRFALSQPWSIGALDAAAARLPADPLRARLFLLFAIIEAEPEFADRFLSKTRSWPYAFIVLLCGLRGVARIVTGMLLRRLIR